MSVEDDEVDLSEIKERVEKLKLALSSPKIIKEGVVVEISTSAWRSMQAQVQMILNIIEKKKSEEIRNCLKCNSILD